MPGRPLFSADTSAFSATSSAREVLTNSDVAGMRARSSRLTMPRVASFRRRCRLSTSLVSKNASRLLAAAKPAASARAREASLPQTWTCMPKALP